MARFFFSRVHITSNTGRVLKKKLHRMASQPFLELDRQCTGVMTSQLLIFWPQAIYLTCCTSQVDKLISCNRLKCPTLELNAISISFIMMHLLVIIDLRAICRFSILKTKSQAALLTYHPYWLFLYGVPRYLRSRAQKVHLRRISDVPWLTGVKFGVFIVRQLG